jgi:hypothetical protein
MEQIPAFPSAKMRKQLAQRNLYLSDLSAPMFSAVKFPVAKIHIATHQGAFAALPRYGSSH